MTNLSTDFFLKDLDAYFYGPNFWQDGLCSQIKDMTFEQALWKPVPDRHCIWEIVLHLNSWKWFAVETLKGNRIENMKEYDWVKIPDNPDENKWKADIEKLKALHEEFKEIVKKAEPAFFDPSEKISGYTREVIYHDCYHGGQIGFLRALQGLKSVE